MTQIDKDTSADKKKIGAEQGKKLLVTRLAVIQTLYSELMSQHPHEQKVAWLDEEEFHAIDETFYHQLLQLSHKHYLQAVPIIKIALDKRQWENMDILYQRLLLCACAEMLSGTNDTSLVINLYCRLSDGFYEDAMGRFTNAVLQNCAKQIADNDILPEEIVNVGS